MAKNNSTQSTLARSDHEQIRTASMNCLIGLIDGLADEISEKIGQVMAVALGGEAWTGRVKDDETSTRMFNIIVDMAGEASAHYSLKDAIAELRFRVSEQAEQRNRGLTIAGGAQ